MDIVEVSAEFEAYLSQLNALVIFCEMCSSEKSEIRANDHRTDLVQSCLYISQQALMLMTLEEKEMRILTNNIETYQKLCRSCKGRSGSVKKEFERRDSECKKFMESMAVEEGSKVVRHPRFAEKKP